MPKDRHRPWWRPSMPVSLACLLALAGAATTAAQEVKVLVQSSPLAGFSHHQAPQHWSELHVGDVLALVREPHNPHDANAVRVDWRGIQMGYLPRSENQAVAAEMDAGARVEGRIATLVEHPNPRKRVRIEVFVLP